MPSLCNGCHQEIRWALTPAGNKTPLDPDPHEDGNHRLKYPDDGRAPVAERLGPLEIAIAQMEDEPLYRSHWFTCPKVEEFRKRKAP